MTLMVILTAKICFILRLTHSECWIYNIIVYNENIITYWFISITRFSLFGARQVKDVPIRWGWRVGWASRGGVLMISKDVPLKWTGGWYKCLEITRHKIEPVFAVMKILHHFKNITKTIKWKWEIILTKAIISSVIKMMITTRNLFINKIHINNTLLFKAHQTCLNTQPCLNK